ncbi:MAG: hypothetical protein E6J91_28430 [Deltaproteobacteria bacterium]|nr:MAG: hypothetical protein E6J91_28430 [Deltaproteobacteria bacterium]
MKLVGERRALAAAIMAFYFLFYGVLAYSQIAPDFTKAFAAIAGVYGLAFFSLVAGYFWARWYSVGVGLYGVISAAVGIWQIGAEPLLVFMGGTHLAATLFLWGQTMSEPYQRLGRSVIRAGVSLPFILLYAFVPRPDGAAALALVAFVLAAVGLRGLVQLRTWGVLAIGVAGALILAMVSADVAARGFDAFAVRPTIAAGMLISAVVPFLRPIARFVTA